MNKPPAVSIVIPTYNHGHFLKKCLQSVIDQTFTNWEAIVVNNFSEDNTIEVVNSFNDSRIRFVNFKNNGIIAASRNIGIKLATADIIAFLDSDDTWYPEKLQKCVEVFLDNKDLVCHNLRYIKNGKYWKDVKCGPLKKASFNNLLYNGSCIITSATMVRKKCLVHVGGFDQDPKVVTSEDYDLWLKLSKEKFRFHFIDEILGEYNVHDSNASKYPLMHINSALTVIDKYFVADGNNDIWVCLKRRRTKALWFYGAARSYQQSGKKIEALRFYLKSAIIFPFILRIYAGMALLFKT